MNKKYKNKQIHWIIQTLPHHNFENQEERANWVRLLSRF